MVSLKNSYESYFKLGFLLLIASNLPDVVNSYALHLKHGSLGFLKIIRILFFAILILSILVKHVVNWKNSTRYSLKKLVALVFLVLMPIALIFVPNYFLVIRQYLGAILILLAPLLKFEIRSLRFYKAIFYLHFILQCIQFSFLSNHMGVVFDVFNLRNTGFFLMPSTSALYTLFTFTLLNDANELSRIEASLFVFSVLLSASGLGIVLLLVYFLGSLPISRTIIGILLVSIGPLFYAILPVLAGRPMLYLSVFERFDNWSKKLAEISVWPGLNSGVFTNAYASLAKYRGDIHWKEYIVDGDVMSFVLNFGLVLGLSFYLLILYRIRKSKFSHVYLLFLLASFTVSILEMLWLPIILLLITSRNEDKSLAVG